jgi:uncharacterized protein (TIGR02611 family)
MSDTVSASTGTTQPQTQVGLRGRARRLRGWVRRRPVLNRVWRVGIGVLGAVIVAVGIVAIPYPGPGWLIVFAGLAVLATEFEWAGRLLHALRGYYDRWTTWLRQQSRGVQLLVGAGIAAIVVATLWLLGAPYLLASWVGLEHWTWMRSPLP